VVDIHCFAHGLETSMLLVKPLLILLHEFKTMVEHPGKVCLARRCPDGAGVVPEPTSGTVRSAIFLVDRTPIPVVLGEDYRCHLTCFKRHLDNMFVR